MFIRQILPGVLGLLLLAGCTTTGERDGSVSIDYGYVTLKQRISGPVPPNAIVAGYGEMAGKQPTLRQLVESNERYLYVIEKMSGSTVRLVTEKEHFAIRDCVAVETSEFTNVRLVEDSICTEARSAQRLQQMNSDAEQCRLAKQSVLIAQTDRQVAAADQQMKALCQFRAPQR